MNSVNIVATKAEPRRMCFHVRKMSPKPILLCHVVKVV